jgi:hypothetical protein
MPTTTTPQIADGTSRPPVSIDGRRRERRRAGRSSVTHERHLQAWQERREAILALAARDARLRLRLHGPIAAIRDAAGALAHPSAEPWQAQRERLHAAARIGSEQAVLQAARAGARKAAGDAARGGGHGPDADMALATATAYKLIQFAPRCLLALHDQGGRTARPAARSGFWR